MRILFLDCTKTAFNGDTLRTAPLGGIESVTVNLAEACARRGHEVCVVNNAPEHMSGCISGVHWSNYDQFFTRLPAFHPDVIIANHDARLLDFARPFKAANPLPVVWMHNRMLLEKTIRKGNMGALLRWRPIGVFLGEKHRKECHFLHPFRRREIMPHGLSAEYLGMLPRTDPPTPPRAIFFSQAYRGLSTVIESWMRYVHPVVADAEFHAYTEPQALPTPDIPYTAGQLAASGIFLHDKVPKAVLRDRLRESRVMIYPGYKDETFCCAATEAQALGVPVVTFGIGALSERVKNAQTGFIAPNGDLEALAKYTIDLLTQEALWRTLSQAAIKDVQSLNWDLLAAEWEQKIWSHDRPPV
ncbi:MAG: glycosyltransferase family 4 protein [Rhodospirillales bacterium]|nr:glycosyltransferase family 4 protein [Rhodospirillales bacterium]MCB9973352.1 glycosyltransferase family 4 protein [Rhodospirillales bacterium]MCB9980554.1 glycosyltransferase family 4 protein [Rhodospirillales bacterium]